LDGRLTSKCSGSAFRSMGSGKSAGAWMPVLFCRIISIWKKTETLSTNSYNY
jgi:hypothetical protein